MSVNYEELEQQAYPGQFSAYDMEVLVPEVQKLEAGEIYLEIGVDRGRSLSVARKVSNEAVKIIGVDIEDNPHVPNTIFIKGDSVEVAEGWLQQTGGAFISVLFIDGDHTYEGCKRDIEAWLPYVKPGGVILFHDCDETSPGVVWAVAEFAYTHSSEIEEYKMCKRTDKNTSMALVRLKDDH